MLHILCEYYLSPSFFFALSNYNLLFCLSIYSLHSNPIYAKLSSSSYEKKKKKRFDNVMPMFHLGYWGFLFSIIVVYLMAVEVGAASAFAGASTIGCFVVVQIQFARQFGLRRRITAKVVKNYSFIINIASYPFALLCVVRKLKTRI